MASVAPAPDDKDEISLGEANTLCEAATTLSPKCQAVLITFPQPDAIIQSSEESVAPSRLRRPQHDESSTQFIDDVEVRRWFFFGKTFAHRSSDCTSHKMELLFGRQRFKHFRGSFMKVSIMMALGCWVPAVYAAQEELYERFALLGGVISPLYLSYAILGSFRKDFEDISGTYIERIIIVALTLQIIAIDFSEWARPRLDYGMLVMHFSFIHNFTPMSLTASNLITFVFGLGLFVFLKLERHFNPHDDADPSQDHTVDKELCIHTGDEADVVIGMLVPFVLLCFQTFITTRRNGSMRKDLLNQEKMKAQKKQLSHEIKSSEDMLRSMLPRQIIASLKKNEAVDPQFFESVTVIFIEICHFGELCSEMEPELVVEVLNVIYLEFDRLSDLLRVYKVETVGQVYMAVVGCPEPIVNHADVAAHFALACLRTMDGLRDRIKRIRVKADQTPRGAFRGVPEHSRVQIRAGLNTGRLRAGVVGLDSPRYKLVGDTVNTASRMESTCEPSKVQVSRDTLNTLSKGLFIVEDRGEIEVKGKGKMQTAFLMGYANPALRERLEVVIERGEPAKTMSDLKMDEKDSIVPVNGRRMEKAPTNTSMQSPGLCDDDSDLAGPIALSEVGSLKKTESIGLTTALPALNAALKRDWFSAHDDDLDASDHAIKSHRMPWYTSERVFGNGSVARRCVQLHRMFLFVSPDYKAPAFLDKLAEDKPVFEECILQSRMAFARNLTLVWLLLLSVVSAVDYYLDIIDTDVDRYRSALIARVVGNQVVGLLYLLFLASPELFQLYAQSVSVLMLIAQGASLLACATLVYNNESSIIALFGVYAMSYTVCTIFQRLCITFFAAASYALVEIYRCDLETARAKGVSIFFLFTLFSFIACGIRLEEFMEHISHFEGRKIARRVDEIKMSKTLGSELLLSLLPSHVVPLVRDCVSPIAEHHKDVTIIFTDIKGFTQYSSQLSPSELMRFLNNMYSAFDEVILNWELYKVEIIGDAYFISAGCPKRDGSRKADEWAMRAVEVALALLRTMPQVCDDPSVKMRVGLHTGAVVAGVVGKKGPRFHLFGPTVAYAEKMESHGEPSRVHISDDTHCLLKEGNHEYEFEERTIHMEGEGCKRTWFVNKSNSKAAQQVARGLIVQRRKSTGNRR